MKKILLIILFLNIYLSASCDIKKNKLENCNFSGKSFENYNFSKKEMSNTDFSGANMFGAIFNKTKMRNIKFNDANLFGTFFVEATLDNVDFSNADISSADFTGASISSTSFKTATQEDTIFGKMIIEKPNIIKVDNCKLIIQNDDKLSWFSLMAGLALDGLAKPSKHITSTLCSWHNGGTFKLKSMTSLSKTKDKFVFNYNQCTFPIYVWTKDDILHIEDHYNPTCLKSTSSTFSSSSSSSSTTLDFVMVEFDVTCGLLNSCIEQNLNISGAGGTGNFSSSYNGAYTGAIHKGYDGKVAGRYSWSAEIKSFDKVYSCSGSFYISGTKRNYGIRVYDNCSDASSGEY
jgi:hypothetical protein